MSNGGKGSSPRPFSVSHDEWSKRWDAIFGRDLESQESTKEKTNSSTIDSNQSGQDIEKSSA